MEVVRNYEQRHSCRQAPERDRHCSVASRVDNDGTSQWLQAAPGLRLTDEAAHTTHR